MSTYWHINNAVSKAVADRDPGGDRLKLLSAASFGDPSPQDPLRISIFRGSQPVTILRCEGRDGNDLVISGAADGYQDAAVRPGDVAANVPTAGDYEELREAIKLLQATETQFVNVVSIGSGDSYLTSLAAFVDNAANPTEARLVDPTHGLPVSVVGGIAFPEDLAISIAPGTAVDLADDAEVNLAAGSAVNQAGVWTVGLSPGTTVGVAGTVAVSQSGAWSVGVAGDVTVKQATPANLKTEATLAGGSAVALNEGSALIGKASAGGDVTGLYAGATAVTPRHGRIDAAALGDNTVVDAVAGKRIIVLRWGLTADGDVKAKWRSNSTDVTGPRPLTKYASAGAAHCPVGVFATAPGEDLKLNLSAAVAVGGELTYVVI